MPGQLSKGSAATPVWLADDDLNPLGSIGSPIQTVSTAATLLNGTNRSGTTSATANQSTKLADANTARKGLNIQNVAATGDIYVNEFGGAAANASGSYRIAAGGSINVRTNQQVNVAGSAASMPYTATEF